MQHNKNETLIEELKRWQAEFQTTNHSERLKHHCVLCGGLHGRNTMCQINQDEFNNRDVEEL